MSVPVVFPPGRDRPAVAVATLQSRLADLTAYFGTGLERETAESFVGLLKALNDTPTIGSTEAERAEWGCVLDAALSIFCQPEFVIPVDLFGGMIQFVTMIGNVLDGCLGVSTDHHIAKLHDQAQGIDKLLVLYGARCGQEMDVEALFKANPFAASLWFNHVSQVMFSGNVNPEVMRRYLDICKHLDGYLPSPNMQEPYFLASYHGSPVEEVVKRTINRAVQAHIDVKVTNTPNPKKVAVFAEYWNEGHSVYRTLHGYIEALKPHFELTLYHSVRDASELDTSLFDHVHRIRCDGFKIDPKPFIDNEFSVAIFPDVGMTGPSLTWSNMRIAPVQVLLTGHPVSTFGGEMDWFVSGEDVETQSHAVNYSERLALLPGFGCIHKQPTYQATGRKKTCDEVLINASWYGQKITASWLMTVNQAFAASGQPVRLRLFCGNAAINHRGLASFQRDVSRLMPSCHVEIVPHADYAAYMGMMEEADFAIDCHPFAGSNTVSDNLWLRKPVVCLEGDRWFNRIGSAMLRSVGLGELAIRDHGDFINLVSDMIRYEHVRNGFTDQLKAADLGATIYAKRGAAEFAEFIQERAEEACDV